MNALDEVLTTEKEAAQAIEIAKVGSVTAIQEAYTEQQTRLEDEEKKLANDDAAAKATEEARVAELANKITTEVDSEVAAIEQRFVSKKEDLKTLVKQKFQ